MIVKYCVCGAKAECSTSGYTCPRCFRRYNTKGKLIGNYHLIEFYEKAEQMDDKTMQFTDDDVQEEK